MLQRDGGEHLVAATREALDHLLRLLAVDRLLEDLAVERDGRIGGQHRREGQVPLLHAAPAGLGLGARQALDVEVGLLARHRDFLHVGSFAGPVAEQQ